MCCRCCCCCCSVTSLFHKSARCEEKPQSRVYTKRHSRGVDTVLGLVCSPFTDYSSTFVYRPVFVYFLARRASSGVVFSPNIPYFFTHSREFKRYLFIARGAAQSKPSVVLLLLRFFFILDFFFLVEPTQSAAIFRSFVFFILTEEYNSISSADVNEKSTHCFFVFFFVRISRKNVHYSAAGNCNT